MARGGKEAATGKRDPYKYEWDSIKLPFKILRVDRDWIWLSETKKIPRVVPFSMTIPAGKVSRETRANLILSNEKTRLPKNLKGYEDDYEKYILPLMAEPFIQKVIVPALVDQILAEMAEKRELKATMTAAANGFDSVDQMARHWYGFGSWEAPYWFIGPEPGATEDSATYLKACAAAWLRCGGTELVDCIQYHQELGFPHWHSGRAPLQPTWRSLIRLLLAFKQRPIDAEEIRTYQRLLWGARDGETAVIELSSQAARSLRTERDRNAYRPERTSTLRDRIREHKPKFVVMYGTGQKQYWEAVAGGPFNSEGLRVAGSTAFLVTPHPQARGMKNADWERFGAALLKSL